MATDRPVVVDRIEEGRPAETRRGRLRALREPHVLILAALVAVYVAARLTILARRDPLRTFDSGSYAGRRELPDPTETLSFTGGSPRPWGAPLLYTIAGTDEARQLLQVLVGITAWVVLVCALWFSLRSLAARVTAAVALFGLALTPAAYLWDHALLSESLSINLGLLTFGLLVVWVRTRSTVILVATVLSTVWWIFTRQDVLLFVGLVLLVLLGLAWRSRPHRGAAVVALVAVVAGLGWSAATLGATDRTFAKWSASGFPQTEETFLYRLMMQVMDDRRMRATYYEDLGMPRCPQLERVTDTSRWNILGVARAYRQCPELQAWADEHKLESGFRYALADPRHYAANMRETLPVALGGRTLRTYGQQVPLLPAAVQSAYFPAERLVIKGTAAVGVIAVLLCLASGAVRRRRWLVVAGVVGVATSIASVLLSLMLSAGEFSRFGIQETIYLRIALLVLLVAALDAALTRRAEKSTAAATAGSTGTPAVTGAGDGTAPDRVREEAGLARSRETVPDRPRSAR